MASREKQSLSEVLYGKLPELSTFHQEILSEMARTHLMFCQPRITQYSDGKHLLEYVWTFDGAREYYENLDKILKDAIEFSLWK